MRLLARLPPQSSRTVNISSGHHASVDDIVGLLGEILGRKLEIETDPARFRKADKLVQVADISLLKQLTGWQPEIALRPGLADLLRFEGLLR
jgi:nucleoside-diphosphate-sugar epimerase